jgi:dynein light chain Tctex-type 1
MRYFLVATLFFNVFNFRCLCKVTFLPESVEPLVNTVIESVLKDKIYNDAMVQKWIDEICSKIIKELVEMNKPFKYLGMKYHVIKLQNHNVFNLASCAIMQKNGAGLHSAHSCFWDRTNDNTVVVKWPNEKRKDPNARVICIVTIFGVAF